MEMLQLWDTLQVVVATLWAQPEVQVIVYHSLVNFVAGVAAALATGTFDFGRLWEFFGKKIIPYVMLYAAARLAGDVVLAGVLPTAIFVAIEAALVKDLIDSLARIPGLDSIIGKLPASLLNTLVKE